VNQWAVFGLGAVGGGLLEFATVNKYRLLPAEFWPRHFRRCGYWIIGGIWVFIGGGLAWLYHPSGSYVGLLCVQIGASGPAIVQTILGKTPPGLPGTVDDGGA